MSSPGRLQQVLHKQQRETGICKVPPHCSLWQALGTSMTLDTVLLSIILPYFKIINTPVIQVTLPALTFLIPNGVCKKHKVPSITDRTSVGWACLYICVALHLEFSPAILHFGKNMAPYGKNTTLNYIPSLSMPAINLLKYFIQEHICYSTFLHIQGTT